jgi:hypothetical protein
MDYDTTMNPTPYDSTVRFEGYLRLDYGSVEGLQVAVSGAVPTRKVTVVPVSETVGHYTVTVRHVVRNVSLRALFNDPGHLPDKAGPATVKAYAKLTTPTLTVLPRASITYAAFGPRDVVVTGYLKPHHRAGSRTITLQFWSEKLILEPGDEPWQLVKTVHVRVGDYGGYSRYRARVTLSASVGMVRCKVRAIHADGDHAKTISGFSKVRNLAT